MQKLSYFALLGLLVVAPGKSHVVQAQTQQLVASFAEQGVALDPARKLCSIAVDVEVRDDLLEYLLVGPGGAVHETGFRTPVQPSVLNAALLALGLEPGKNATWKPVDPPPTEEQMRAGARPYDVEAPAGDGLYLYVGWRRGDERYFFRIEDLIRNLGEGASMRRHAWVFLGSKMISKSKKSDEQVFAADVYQNLICISFFSEGFTLLTGALPECVAQNVWMLNAWVLPPTGSRLRMFFSRERIEHLTSDLEALLPEVASAVEPREK